MQGHEIRLSETNGGDFVPLCECGWIGTVSRCVMHAGAKTKRAGGIRDLAKSEATKEHAQHLEDVKEATAAVHAEMLDAHASYLRLVRPTVTRIGRWGNG